MRTTPSGLTAAAALPLVAGGPRSAGPSTPEAEVILLFDQFRYRLARYITGFGLSTNDAEEIVQEVFLSLFRHLQLGRSRQNLRGWIFRVAHNLALKQRYANKRSLELAKDMEWSSTFDFGLERSPEEQVLSLQRRQRLMAVFTCLPEQDRCCLQLRAEGLRYREIARVLGVSLGTVAASLSRSLERLARADTR